MNTLINSPAATGIATCTALGAFAGASLAMLTGRDEELERDAARGSVWGGLAGIALELTTLVGRATVPVAAVRSQQ